MAFNIEVVNTAALTVDIAERYTNFNGVTVPTTDANYVYDELRVNKVFFTIYDKLSTPEIHVYHRLKVWVISTEFTMNSALPYDGAYNYISLIPLLKHNPVPALPSPDAGFAEAENTFLVADALANRVIGKLRRTHSTQTPTVCFELQYQEDPMPLGVPAGRNLNGTWVTYTNATSENQIISDESGDLTQYRLRTVHTTDNYTPGDTAPQGRLYVRDANNTGGSGTLLPTSLKVAGKTYTVQATPDTAFPDGVLQVLYTETMSPYAASRTTVDYVLLLSDDAGGTIGVVNDYVTYTSPPGKDYVDIYNHITYKRNGPLVPQTGTTNLKLFRGNDSSTKKTKIYTDLIWPQVGVKSYDMTNDDNEFADGNNGAAGDFGFWDFDAGQTRIGVDIDPATNHVYLLVRLSKHSTTQFFDELDLQMITPSKNKMDGDGIPAENFDSAPANFDSSL